MRLRKQSSILIGLLIPLCVPALARAGTGSFYIGLGGDASHWNQIISSISGGDGWNGLTEGPWYTYAGAAGDVGQSSPGEIVNPQPGWVNQWWYDHPYDPLRWKEVTLHFTYGLGPAAGAQGGANIIINYSTPAYSALPENGFPDPRTSAPPPGQEPHPGDWIGRVQVGQLWLNPNDPNIYTFDGTFDLRTFNVNYNPEWVSVDVVGFNFIISSPAVPGSITHDCVPEPASILLLGLGGLMLMGRRR